MKKREDTYNFYWYFAAERQKIFYNKLHGMNRPWTEDEILQDYKFCNAYRASDRISQYLLKNVIYNGNKYRNEDMIFRIILFKIFNKESTWEILIKEFGDITLNNFDKNQYSKVLSETIKKGKAIFNDAYITCPTKVFGYDTKHDNYLQLLYKMFIEDKVYIEIMNTDTMKQGFDILKRYPMIGNFMAYQLITDINYSEVVNYTETEFTVVGPGSERGIKKCFENLGGKSKEEIIKWMCDNQESEFKRLGLEFKDLGGRKLQYIDCQGLFCEVDKYCRQARPELASNRKRIKKKYKENEKKIDFFYPPKWNINLNKNTNN